MSEPDSAAESNSSDPASPRNRSNRIGGNSLTTQYPWLVFVAPFVVYMLFNSFEPAPLEPAAETAVEQGETGEPSTEEESPGWLPSIDYEYYPLVYTAKIVATLAVMLILWSGYTQFPWTLSPLAPLIGVFGCVVWIGLCQLSLEQQLGEALGVQWLIDLGQRSSFNPLREMSDQGLWAYAFLGIRFVGLAAVVPVIEEFFLRGFLMRYLIRENWTDVPFGTPDFKAIAIVTVLAMAMHPGELLAELAWFSLVTWLMIRTRNIWDCVVAHAVTNFLLGVYVVTTGHWELM